MSNFNFIAPFYDLFAKLIFGNKLFNAKMQFVNVIKPGSHILIVGGGTGDILNNIVASTENTRIDFIEPSKAMIKIAAGRLFNQYANRVNFINENHNHIPMNKEYDIAIIFFILDMFKQDEAYEISKKINDSLKQDGMWLFADFFYTTNYFQRTLVWMMYRFFRITAGVSANKLPDYDAIFAQNNVVQIDEKCFMKGLVRSRVYKKVEL